MKTRILLSLAMMFIFSASVKAVDDDCPCRKKKVVIIQKVAPKKVVVPVVKKKIYKDVLFEDIPIVYENLCKGTVKERQNVKVRIMPNPVLKYINVIYDTENGQKVKIELLSCQGKLIKTLLNEVVYGEGLKESTFDINGQVSRGDAYVRLTSGVITKMEKIFIL
ncbi:MAG: hypothetical protein WCK84_00650 [Bacteroidota bacterium]